MGFIDILLIGVSLAADAFAVAVCKGLSTKIYSLKKSLIISLYFGFFQGFMPLMGYLLGNLFKNFIMSIDHWISFVLLVSIGANMIRESFFNNDDTCNNQVDFKEMIPLALATSIDAFAVGITFSFLKVNIILFALLISFITFALSFIGSKIGFKFGLKYKSKAEIIGGFILVLMGIKMLLEHLVF